MEGVSLREALDGRPLSRPHPLFWEHEGNRAVRSGNWKIVSVYPEAWELYDITADRVERHDVARTISASAPPPGPGLPTSSSASRTSGTRGPNGHTWIPGQVRRDCRGAT